MRLRPLLVIALLVLALAPAARADAPPSGSTWTQATITEPDGTKLHADVLRPSNLPADAKTPVIVSVAFGSPTTRECGNTRGASRSRSWPTRYQRPCQATTPQGCTCRVVGRVAADRR